MDGLVYVVYILLFLIGGTLATYNIVPYRMVYVAALPLFAMPKYGVQWDRISGVSLIFLASILLSAWVNDSSLIEVLLFARFVIVPYSMYYCVKIGITRKNIRSFIRLSIGVGVSQLPIIGIQSFFFDSLSDFFADEIARVDALFGSFYMADDAAMSFFLLALVMFLLLDGDYNSWVRHRLPLAIYYSITILASNSEITHLLLVATWGYYFLTELKKRQSRFLKVIAMAVVLICFAMVTDVTQRLESTMFQLSREHWEDQQVEKFLAGDYARGAAVLHYLSEPLKLAGDGPLTSFDPRTQEYILGNRGQIFIFYSEIGLIGLASSVLVFLGMATGMENSSRAMRWPLFVGISALTLTSNVMSDASLMFTYPLFLSTGLLKKS